LAAVGVVTFILNQQLRDLASEDDEMA